MALLALRFEQPADASFVLQMMHSRQGRLRRQQALLGQEWFVLAALLTAAGEFNEAATALATHDKLRAPTSPGTVAVLDAGRAIMRLRLGDQANLNVLTPTSAELADKAEEFEKILGQHFGPE